MSSPVKLPAVNDKDVSQLEASNVDISKQPLVNNKDGSTGTIRPHQVEIDGAHVVLPSVDDEGNIKTHAMAIKDYLTTGNHMGKYTSSYSAEDAGRKIQQQQEQYKQPVPKGGKGRVND